VVFSIFFYFFPRLIPAVGRLDVCHAGAHGVIGVALVRI